jgi:FkbM family methyltransferase
LRATGTRSYVWADGFWWYRWHPDAGIGFTPEWEKPIEGYILRSGSCFVDAGSHVGRWTLRASPFYREVLAFEPDPFTNFVLRRNIARNDITNVLVFSTALSNRRARAALFNYGPLACNSLRDAHVSGRTAKAAKPVEVRPLDDFMNHFQVPMVLKIDVEGEELKVLEGGATTLGKFKPLVLVEVHFRNEIDVITDRMKLYGYDITGQFQDLSNPNGVTYLVLKSQEV